MKIYNVKVKYKGVVIEEFAEAFNGDATDLECEMTQNVREDVYVVVQEHETKQTK